MKFPAFEYARAHSLAEAYALINATPDARILAGGQSLLATLALRLSEPPVLVDIGGLAELRFIERRADALHIGALTRHHDLETNALIAEATPLLHQAVPHVAHAAIRNRGTLGGSLAHADPAAELPACMLALDATMVIGSPTGERRVPAADFFQGLYQTAVGPGELLLRVEIPLLDQGWQCHFDEISRRRGDFAIVGLAAANRRSRSDGPAGEWRLVYFGCGDRAIRANATESLLRAAPGASLPDRAALKRALEKDLTPQSDLQASASMRIHLAAVLAERAIAALQTPSDLAGGKGR